MDSVAKFIEKKLAQNASPDMSDEALTEMANRYFLERMTDLSEQQLDMVVGGAGQVGGAPKTGMAFESMEAIQLFKGRV